MIGGDGDDGPPGTGGRGSPVDFERLEIIGERLSTDDRFVRIEDEPEFAPDRLACVYDPRFYRRSRPSASKSFERLRLS